MGRTLKILMIGLCFLIVRTSSAELVQFSEVEKTRLRSTAVAKYQKPFEPAAIKSTYSDELVCLASSPLNDRRVEQNYFSAAGGEIHYLTANAHYHVPIQNLSKTQCVKYTAGTANKYPVYSIEVRDSKKIIDRLQVTEFTETNNSRNWSVSKYEDDSVWPDRPCQMRPDDATSRVALEAGRKILHQHIIDKLKRTRARYDSLVANRATVPCTFDNCGELPNPNTYIDALKACAQIPNEAVRNAVADQLLLFGSSGMKKQTPSVGTQTQK